MKKQKKPRKVPKPKTKRAPRGEGSIFPDKRNGGYRGKVPVGRYPNGRTKYTEVSGRTHAEVVAKKKLVQPPKPDITVSEWADRWLDASPAAPPTKDDIRNTIGKYIKPTLGSRRVADLTAHDIENAGRAWAPLLGPNTLRKNLRQVRTMLQAANRAKIVTENVARDAKLPKGRRVDINPFSPAQITAILAEAAKRPPDAIVALLATVGCRLGEAIAADVTDFDPKAGTVSISKTYTRKHGIRRPKSENGVRTVRVPAPALPILIAATKGLKGGPLFPSDVGTHRAHESVRKSWRRLLNRIGLRYRNPHQLRHSVASIMVARGAPLPDIAKYLGDSVETVVSTYLHPSGSDVAATIEDALSGA